MSKMFSGLHVFCVKRRKNGFIQYQPRVSAAMHKSSRSLSAFLLLDFVSIWYSVHVVEKHTVIRAANNAKKVPQPNGVISLPGVWFYTLVSGYTQHKCVK